MAQSLYSAMDARVLIAKLNVLFDDLDIGTYQLEQESNLGIVVRAEIEDVYPMMDALRHCSELQFEQLIDTFGADVRDLIEVTYRLRSLTNNIDLIIKSELPYGAVYSSVGAVYPAAWMPERELCEMFGLSLLDHPNPKRLLTTSDLPPFLRKEVTIRTKEEIWG